MKKAVYMMAAAALALTSCATDEVTDVAKSSNITFRTSVGLNSRGSELRSDNIQEMWVTALKDSESRSGEPTKTEFSDFKFVRDGNEFVCNEHTLPWPKDRTMLFYATNPSHASLPCTFSYQSLWYNGWSFFRFENLTPNEDIALQQDILLGWNVAKASTHASTGVQMTLGHVLPQIKVAIKNSDPNLIYRVAGIKVANVVKSRTLTFTRNFTATNLEDIAPGTAVGTTNYVTTFTPFNLPADNQLVDITNKCKPDAPDCGIMPLPQKVSQIVIHPDGTVSGQYFALLLNVKSKDGRRIYPAAATSDDDFGWAAVSLPEIQWYNGNKYQYTLDLSKGCGEVDPVEPNPDGGGVVDPGGKDPDKGESIFGFKIYFDCTVTPWTDDNRDITIH